MRAAYGFTVIDSSSVEQNDLTKISVEQLSVMFI